MRLSKVLASNGIASRRKADELIAKGRVHINSKVATLGQQYQPGDTISVDKKPLTLTTTATKQQPIVIAFNKPINTLCSHSDPKNRTLIYQYLEVDPNRPWISIGRLDFKTTGLLLLTNCGDLAHKLMHPSSQIEREYWVKIKPKISQKDIQKILAGIILEDGPARVVKCRIVEVTQSSCWVSLSLLEGRNREVRRIFEKLSYDVLRLKRVRYGNINLNDISSSGQTRLLSQAEIQKLLSP